MTIKVEDWREILDVAEFVKTLNKPENMPKEMVFYVDVAEVNTLNPKVMPELMTDPDPVLKSLKKTLSKLYPKRERIDVVFKNFGLALSLDKVKIHQIRSRDINKVVIFDGLVRLSTDVLPRAEELAFQHNDASCMQIIMTPQPKDEEIIPMECPFCNTSLTDRNRIEREDLHEFEDFQLVTIEEEPEGLKGRQPERIECQMHGPFTKEGLRVGVGERVCMLGIYRVRKKGKKVVHEKYLEVIGVDSKGKNYEDFILTPEEIAKFDEMSKNSNLLVDLASNLAPNIYGYEMVKAALMLQMFGGHFFSPEKRRGDIHILLIGDPGVGKSKITNSIVEIAPHVMKASGAPTTSVGLTAAAVESKEGDWCLEAGAAVLADRGQLIIDELDKMDVKVRGALHEIMEDQTCTVNKVGISATLMARCSVLGIMNPKFSRFDPQQSVASQINIVPSLLSRFDLIFAIRDKIEEENDRQVADAIFRGRDGIFLEQKYEKEDITKYIIYARSKILKMRTSDEAKHLLTEEFIKLRKQNKDANGEDVVAVTNRQLEGAARLAEAHAKMRLSSVVELQDAEAAMKIITHFLDTMCRDDQGNISVDQALGGKSSSEKQKAKDLLKILQGMAAEDNFKKVYTLEDIMTNIPGISKDLLRNSLDTLNQQGKIHYFSDKSIKVHNL